MFEAIPSFHLAPTFETAAQLGLLHLLFMNPAGSRYEVLYLLPHLLLSRFDIMSTVQRQRPSLELVAKRGFSESGE